MKGCNSIFPFMSLPSCWISTLPFESCFIGKRCITLASASRSGSSSLPPLKNRSVACLFWRDYLISSDLWDWISLLQIILRWLRRRTTRCVLLSWYRSEGPSHIHFYPVKMRKTNFHFRIRHQISMHLMSKLWPLLFNVVCRTLVYYVS
jgi:hypothetical protein